MPGSAPEIVLWYTMTPAVGDTAISGIRDLYCSCDCSPGRSKTQLGLMLQQWRRMD